VIIMSDVLLTYGWVRSSYGALRNLKRHGLDVVVSDSSCFGMSQFSRFSSGFEKYTSHFVDEEQFISDLSKICSARDIKMILPSHNETEVIARHRDRFKPSLVAMIPDEAHCRIFNNKSKAYDFVASLGIPTPSRVKYQDPNSVAQILRNRGVKKTVIKLLTGNSSKGVYHASSPEDAEMIVKSLIQEFGLVRSRYPQVEEYVRGEGYGCSVLYSKGTFITHFTHKRLRDKIDTGGTSTYREASMHDGIEAATRVICDSIGWNGLAMCEFKVCPNTGNFWFIEVNPRMWGSISLAIESGVQFPYLAWLCATQGEARALAYNASCSTNVNWRARWLLGDIFVFVSKLLSREYASAWAILTEEKADSIDDFFWDDPLAFVGEVFAYLKSTISNRSTNPSKKGMLG
jgi:predicted ATP-grasp superfamily ATP-dependent carboligase